MRRPSVDRRRQRWSVRLAAVLFALAALSQARVQIFQRGAILAKARETNRFAISRIEYARRGAIFSSDGKPLAQDDDTYEMSVRFDKVPRTDSFFMALAGAADVPASDLAQASAAGVRSLTWQKPMSSAQARDVQEVKLTWRSDGVSIRRTNKRAYPLGSAAAGFIGTMQESGPIAGLELSQNKVLAGTNGKTVGFVDRTGAFLPTRLDPETKERKDGKDLVLTIDSNLQQAAAVSLKSAVDKYKADDGIAIVMDPRTGDVLAMANWPSYEPDVAGSGIQQVKKTDLNPNYMMVLEPGSTFKILTLAKALDRGVVGPNETFYCGGTLQVWPTKAVRCDLHGGTRAHGQINPELAIARSCNVWAATLAARVGYDEFISYQKDLGLFQESNLGVPLETRGQYNSQEYAKPLQLATMGFGQSVSCTPIGLASAFAILGNEGKRPEPRLIKKIGGVEAPLRPQRSIVKRQTAEKVLQFMESVFSDERGTGKSLRIPGYRIAGKTGTAQRVRRSGGGGYVSNFVGFVPADKPRAMILVMVDNPKGAYYGAVVAGPVFREIAQAVIRRYAIPPSSPAEITTRIKD